VYVCVCTSGSPLYASLVVVALYTCGKLQGYIVTRARAAYYYYFLSVVIRNDLLTYNIVSRIYKTAGNRFQ